MVKLILSGGGSAKDSRPLDELLLSLILSKRRLLYLPTAWTGDVGSCRKWFSSTFHPLGFDRFDMWTELHSKTYSDLADYGAIYIGGGNTFHLLYELRKAKLIEPLRKYILQDRPVYGGSAGAIILGRDISTAGFGKDADQNEVGLTDLRGLNLVGGYMIQCHYHPQSQDRQLYNLARRTGFPIIAIPEQSGVFVNDDHIIVKGSKPVCVFVDGEKVRYVPDSVIAPV